MLISHSNSALQMMDIIACHIIPKLHLRDVQALGQTCRQLRALTHTTIPEGSWRTSASLSLPAGHPLLTAPPDAWFQQLTRLANLNAAIFEGRLASVSGMTIGPSPAGAPTSVAISPSGRLMVAKRGPTLVLSRLVQSQPTGCLQAEDMWSMLAPPPSPPWGYTPASLGVSEVVNCQAVKGSSR